MTDSGKEQSQPTDSLIVMPKEELAALIEAIYYVLEKSTSEDFPTVTKKQMLSALKRLE